MTKVFTFTHKGQDIDVLYNKGKIAYTFEIAGKKYGGAVKVEGRSHEALINATFALLINYLETKEAVEKI